MDDRASLVLRMRAIGKDTRDSLAGVLLLEAADALDASQPPAADEVEAVRQAIWDTFCPAIRRTPEDDERFREAAVAVLSTLRSQQSKEIERLKETLGEIAKDSNPDWTEHRVYASDVLDDIHKMAVDALYNRAGERE
jgi:hypothetical protein